MRVYLPADQSTFENIKTIDERCVPHWCEIYVKLSRKHMKEDLISIR